MVMGQKPTNPSNPPMDRKVRQKGWKARRKCIVRQKFYEDLQYLESPTLWFTTVKSNFRYFIRRNPEILESLLEVST